jgi:hypothetical protein
MEILAIKKSSKLVEKTIGGPDDEHDHSNSLTKENSDK